MNVPFNKPWLCGNEEGYVLDALRSLRHSGNLKYGKQCNDFIEKTFGVKKSFLVPSGTAALEMGCLLMDLKPGDEVILPSYTFSSTANAVVLQGAVPVFVDIREDTFNIDENQIEAAITKKTKAIMPIVYGGVSANLEKIQEIADKYKLFVFEDAAQGSDAKYKGKYVGSVPKLSMYSFHETKNHACGEGGALLVNDESLFQQAEFIQEKGTDRSLVIAGMKNKYGWVSKGSSFLLADVLAAQLLAQLEAKAEILARRKKLCDSFAEALKPFVNREHIQVQAIPLDCQSNFHAFYLLFPQPELRQAFLQHMRERGISSYIGYVPLHSSAMGKKIGAYRELPVTDKVGACLARLPLYTGMTEAEVEYVNTNMTEVLRGIFK